VTGNSLQVDGFFDYTYFDAPLLVSAETDDERLEGEQIEIHDQFFKYVDGANTVDHTPIMQERLDAQFTNQGTIDFSGNIAVHVKGINVNLTLGSRLMNFTGGVKPRVRSITYDLVARNMELSISNQLLRQTVDQAKEMKRARTLRGTENWHQNKLTVNPVDINCFSGWTEADGDPTQTDRIRGGGGSSGGGFPDSWSAPRQKFACINGVCTQTADGQYGSLEDCQAACKAYYYCLDKDRGVCASALTSGGSMSAEECAANCKPDGTGVTRYVCFRDGCHAVENARDSDGYATLDDCCQACAGEQNKGPCAGGAKGPQAKACDQQKPIIIVDVNEAGQVLDVECNQDLEGAVDCSTNHGAIRKLTQRADGKVVIAECVVPVTKTVVTAISCSDNQLQVTTEDIKVWPNET
jgi:hypothetical protein